MIERLQYISQGEKHFEHLEAIEKACRAGARWIQLRIKNEHPVIIEGCAREARKICDGYEASLIINDWPELAKKIKADGVHVGKRDMPLHEVRKIVGKKMVIGGTANTIDDIRRNIDLGADYVGVGPFRFTATKKDLSPVLGLEGYQRIIKRFRDLKQKVPLIAIGGIGEEDVRDIADAGFYGVAISSAITHAADSGKTVKSILKNFENVTI